MEFVAKTLGASSFDTFRTAILPICRSSIISTFVLTSKAGNSKNNGHFLPICEDWKIATWAFAKPI